MPDFYCDRCRKRLATDKTLCSTCQTVGDCTIDIGPAALAAFVADSAGGTANESDTDEWEAIPDAGCGGESDGGCAAADGGCCGGD